MPEGAKKKWVAMEDTNPKTGKPRTSKICLELADHPPIPVDQPFESSIVGPIMQPPAHPNCRSTMVLVFV
jgi:hypothetical protein